MIVTIGLMAKCIKLIVMGQISMFMNGIKKRMVFGDFAKEQI